MLALAIACTLAADGHWMRAAAAERLAGNVLAIDVDASSITLLDAGHRHLIEIIPEATIRTSGKTCTLADLKRGDRIIVTLVEGEPNRAARVVIAGPGKVGPGTLAAGASVPGFASGLNARNLPR